MMDFIDDKYRKSSVLAVDDEQLSIELIRKVLSPLFTIHAANNGEQAIEMASLYQPDLILLDIMMEGLDGTEICNILKSKPETKNIPVIFVTNHYEDSIQQLCWEAGCVDFITKPINNLTLIHRVKTHIDNKIKTEILESLIKKDPLTNTSNRLALDEDYPIATGFCRRNATCFSLLMIDIDNFKVFNDTYGHTHGDAALIEVAIIIKESLNRSTDKIYRFGGEEFVVILPNTDKCGTELLSKKIISNINNKKIKNEKTDYGYVTISIGGVVYNCENIPDNIIEALNVADDALYHVKNNGRNNYLLTDGKKTIKTNDVINDDKKEIKSVYSSSVDFYADWNKSISLHRIGNDNELYNEIIDIFLKSTPGYIKSLKLHIDNENLEKVVFFSHKLKGICGDIGAERLGEFLSIIEIASKLNEIYVVKHVFNKIIPEFDKVKSLIENDFDVFIN